MHLLDSWIASLEKLSHEGVVAWRVEHAKPICPARPADADTVAVQRLLWDTPQDRINEYLLLSSLLERQARARDAGLATSPNEARTPESVADDTRAALAWTLPRMMLAAGCEVAIAPKPRQVFAMGLHWYGGGFVSYEKLIAKEVTKKLAVLGCESEDTDLWPMTFGLIDRSDAVRSAALLLNRVADQTDWFGEFAEDDCPSTIELERLRQIDAFRLAMARDRSGGADVISLDGRDLRRYGASDYGEEEDGYEDESRIVPFEHFCSRIVVPG